MVKPWQPQRSRRRWDILHLNSFSHLERDSTRPASPLLTLPWQQMPSLLFILKQQIHTLIDVLSPCRKCQCPPPHPASPTLPHRRDHSKSLHHPCRGSSPGNTTGESPHRKTEEWAKQPAEGELHVPFGVTHTCHFSPKALGCRGTRSPKGPISLCIKNTAQHWHFLAFRFYVSLEITAPWQVPLKVLQPPWHLVRVCT